MTNIMLTMAISSLIFGIMGWTLSKTSLQNSMLADFSSILSCILALFVIVVFVFSAVEIVLN